MSQNELVKSLTDMGYKATDVTSKAIVDGLGSVESLTGGSVVRHVTNKGASTLWSMNTKVAKQVCARSPAAERRSGADGQWRARRWRRTWRGWG